MTGLFWWCAAIGIAALGAGILSRRLQAVHEALLTGGIVCVAFAGSIALTTLTPVAAWFDHLGGLR